MMEMLLMSWRSFMKYSVVFLFPLMREMVGKWFTGIYETKRIKSLCIVQLIKWFLKDENGDVDVIEMRFLKPRAGLSMVMEFLILEFFKIQDVIDGALEVLLLRGKNWDVPHYECIAPHAFQRGIWAW